MSGNLFTKNVIINNKHPDLERLGDDETVCNGYLKPVSKKLTHAFSMIILKK